MGEVKSSMPIIEGVSIYPLKQFKDERGMVMHMLRNTDPWFEQFGEIYFSQVKSGVIKAWKRHKKMTQFFTVPFGKIKLVIYDDRAMSPTKGLFQTLQLSVNEHYGLVKIPPMLWYGFKGDDATDSLLANCATIPHDPDESENLPINSSVITYDWEA